MIQRNFKLCDFPVHSVCFLQNFFFRSEEKLLSVLYHCAKFYKFSPSTFRDIFRSKYKFCKIFEGTRSLNLHLREPGELARNTRNQRPRPHAPRKLFRATSSKKFGFYFVIMYYRFCLIHNCENW